jgi:transposase
MGYKRKKFEARGFDELKYRRYFHNNQQEYVRMRLRCLAAYAEGMEFRAISEKYQIHEQSCRSYINMYIEGGFEKICAPIERNQPKRLSAEEEQSFKQTLLSKRPTEVGLQGNIWTGDIMCQYIKQRYKVEYRKGIYDLLKRLNLTYQKAHSDYGNADPEQQLTYLEDLSTCLLEADDQTAVIKFDEFSVCERPSSHYGWAEKNTRPTVVTDEKKENEQMDF